MAAEQVFLIQVLSVLPACPEVEQTVNSGGSVACFYTLNAGLASAFVLKKS